MIKLDFYDKKILYELDLNARISDSELAKKTNLSREIVRYRINKLEKEGIIRGYSTIVNTMKLGYLMYRTYFKFSNINLQKEKEIIDYLQSKVNWVTKVEGNWDLGIMIFVKSVYDYDNFVSEFKRQYGNYISKSWVATMTKLWHFKRGYLLDKKDSNDFILMGLKTNDVIVDLDDIDNKILSILVDNARMRFLEIAKKLNLHEKLVRDRIKKLISKDIILGYTTFLDTKLLDKFYFKINFILKNHSSQDFKRLLDFSLYHPNIVYVVEAVGGSDLELEVHVNDNTALYALINEIKNKFSEIIVDYNFMEYTKEYKFSYLPNKKIELENKEIKKEKKERK